MTPLRLRLLGTPALFLADQQGVFKTRKTLALLAYLAVEQRAKQREEVADLLWPMSDAEGARSSLRTTIRHLRSALGDTADAVVVATRDSIGLSPSALLDLDVDALSHAHHQTRTPGASLGLRRDVEQALSLYRGPFLADLSVPDAPEFEAWLTGQRAHWLGVVSQCLDWLSSAQIEADDGRTALLTLERWATIDPGEEVAWQRMLELHLAQGNRVGFRRTWRACRGALADLGIEPGAQLEALASQIGTHLSSSPASVSDAESSARREMDLLQMPFVGRARELMQLRRAFVRAQSGEPQVVVLEGEAGIGKSRLGEEFLAWAAIQGADVVRSRGFETTVDLSYGSLIDGLRNRLDQENAPDDLLDDPWLAEISQLLPELRVRYPDLPLPTSDPALGRHKLFEAVTRLWKVFAMRRPLVMFRDDWHWSDTDSRDLLRYALHRFSQDHDCVLLVVAVSAEQLGTDRRLAQWMGGLERDAPTTRLALERLTLPDIVLWIAALAGNEGEGSFTDTAAARLGEWLIERAGRRPSQILAALRSLLDQELLAFRQSDEGSWLLDLARVVQIPARLPAKDAGSLTAQTRQRHDWGDAPDGRLLLGRRGELDELEGWVLTGEHRVVAVLGMGGIGKTALTARLARDVAAHFEFIFWRSLRNALPFDDWLVEAIHTLSDQQLILPDNWEARILLLIELLRTHRCLLVLDSLETVLEPGQRESRYREGYGAYGTVLRQVGEVDHLSCLLLTSREKPLEVGLLEGEESPVRSFQLKGLVAGEGRALLRPKGLVGADEDWEALVERYAGNPLALGAVGETIGDVFGGNIAAFLAEGEVIFGGTRRLLDVQFGCLSPLEQSLLYWLAVKREPIGFVELLGDLEPPSTRGEVLEAVEGLQRRSMLPSLKSGAAFTLEPVVLEYVTDRLVSGAGREVQDGQLALLRTHALLKAQSKNYIRQSQERLIMMPILDRLVAIYGGKDRVEQRLADLLDELRSEDRRDYASGNMIELLRLLRGNLRGLDLSHLFIRQSYLQEVEAQDASLRGAHLVETVLGQAYDFPTSVALSADGAFLAAGTPTGEVHLWRVAERTPLPVLSGHRGGVWEVALSGDGRLVASASEDGTVRLWEAGNGRLLHILQGHVGGVWGVAFSGDGRLVASGSMDGTVKLWQTDGGACLVTARGHTGAVWSVALSGDGHMVASGSHDGTVRLWEATRGQLRATLPGHVGQVCTVALSADGQVVASGGEDGTMRLWETRDGRLRHTLWGHAGGVGG